MAGWFLSGDYNVDRIPLLNRMKFGASVNFGFDIDVTKEWNSLESGNYDGLFKSVQSFIYNAFKQLK